MDNFSYYPKGITIKDGRISEENLSQNKSETNTSTPNSFPNFGNLPNLSNLFSNKNINDLLPLLLGKGLNKNEMFSQIMNNMTKEEKTKKDEKKVTLKKQNYLDEM